MSSKGKARVTAASIAAVEALKDQGFAKWDYPLRSLKQHAETNLRSLVQATKLSPSSAMDLSKVRDDQMKESEVSLESHVPELLGPK